jgi:predicted PurR-regulated permease PerM
MTEPNPLKAPGLEYKALLWVVLGATLLFAVILWPFFGALCWAVFIAIVFWPLNRRFLMNSRGQPRMAALGTVVTILVIVILPIALIAANIAQEASAFIGKMRSGDIRLDEWAQRILESLPAWIRNTLDHIGIADLADVQDQLLSMLGANGHAITSRAFSIGHLTFDFVLAFFVMVYLLYFLFRDGERLTHEFARTIPLREEHTSRLLTQFATVVRATVKGNLAVALVHGVLGGLGFVVAGVPEALLWGTAMAFFSLIPAIGAFLIWGPVVAWIFFTGATVKAIAVALWCALVVGTVDNFVRPALVGRDTRIPEWLILVATLGGIGVFGLNGFVIGPVIAAIFLVSWQMLAEARRPQRVPNDQEGGADAGDDSGAGR